MLSKKLQSVLEKTADVNGIKYYEVHLDENVLRGDGLLSESFTGYIKDKGTGEIVHSYIKKIPSKSGDPVPDAFFNENEFYSSLWPELNKFQQEKGVESLFTNIPKYYCGSKEPGEQYVCMENLKIQKYDLIEKSETIDEGILKMIFERYGQFHALTFAFKDQNIEKYKELVRPIRDMYVSFEKNKDFVEGLESSFRAAYEALEEIDLEKSEKIKPYAENIFEYYQNIKVYGGKFSSLVHGDCWSNNLLFKHGENGILEDIKFIDFQLCRDSTPIHDLSYFFYSGASKEDFKKLDEYLELYHKSFSAFAQELGSDPNKLLPLSILKSEWKKHSFLGIIMGIMLWQIKLLSKDTINDLSSKDHKGDGREIIKLIQQSEIYKRNTTDILLHALDYGIL